jgi:hypothetical protein
VLHALPIPSFLTWFQVYLATSTSYEAFSNIWSLHPSSGQVFSLAPCSQTPSLNVRDQISHLSKPQAKL